MVVSLFVLGHFLANSRIVNIVCTDSCFYLSFGLVGYLVVFYLNLGPSASGTSFSHGAFSCRIHNYDVMSRLRGWARPRR